MAKSIAYTVAESVFRAHPSYRVGVVLARDVRNGESQPALTAMLHQACADLHAAVSLETLSTDQHVQPWREAFRGFGARPSDYRSSVEALARRGLRGSLSSLGRLIDIGTVISLRNLVPVGGHALESVRDDIALRPAAGGESFHAFGAMTIERPMPGEIVFAEGDTVLTRRWVWRQSERTAIKPDTRCLVYNVDVLPDIQNLDVKAICADLAELITEFAGGDLSIDVLDAEHPHIDLTL